jgi:ABC-type transport system involved in multi-copper enzyme maturation permease subunit
LSGGVVIARFALRECVRRRVFLIVGLLTFGFLGLYGLGTWQIFRTIDQESIGLAGVEPPIVAGATLVGLAMFATLFLGAVLAVFLTLGVVRGDAESGLLQPVLVRPVSRGTLLVARFAAAAVVSGAYVIAVALVAMILTYAIGDWWPDRVVGPLLGLAFAVAIIAALSLAGSVVLTSTANGIAVFMVFGAGLTAGLLGQIGEGLNSETLQNIARVSSWALPFEALYQAGLAQLTADTVGFTRLAIQLGPFGGAQSASPLLWLWSIGYLGLVGAAALAVFKRRDL